MMKNTIQPSEWIIMEKLWEKSPRTIMQIFHSVEEDPGWSKSTVNTMIRRMTAKGMIYYEEGAKAKQFYPNIKREDAAIAETKNLLNKVYQGSVAMMMNTLVKKHKFSKEEIQEMQALLDELGEE
ncbi:MAG: BlaI/MecI/CopY family transcriptional regulator [Lachnospiraceae bacterium]|nr:BlaI/MecI/CopY family transcriptional regulator [Lachnospiraceae bacterium]